MLNNARIVSEGDPIVLKTSLRYWILELGLPVLFGIMAPILMLVYGRPIDASLLCKGILVLPIMIIYFLMEIKPASNALILIDPFKIRGRIGDFHFNISFDSIQMIKISRFNNNQLNIFTNHGLIQIPCKYFNKKELISILKAFLPAEVFDAMNNKKISIVRK